MNRTEPPFSIVFGCVTKTFAGSKESNHYFENHIWRVVSISVSIPGTICI